MELEKQPDSIDPNQTLEINDTTILEDQGAIIAVKLNENSRVTEDCKQDSSNSEGQQEGPKNSIVDETVNDGFAKPNPTFVSPSFRAPKRFAVGKGRKAVVDNAGSVPKEDLAGQKSSTLLAEEQTSKIKAKQGNQNEINAEKQQIPYQAPSWSTVCTENYYFDVLKGGVMKDTIDLSKKEFYMFGRLEGCDVTMEHPSVSRYHAVVVYRGKSADDNAENDSGFYIMDLGSTHGTSLNKQPLNPKVYYRLRVGYVVKFGGSTRLYILQGPNSDQDEEIERSTFVIRKVVKERMGDNELQSVEENDDAAGNDDGISWGFGEDAMEEEMDLEKLLASRKPLELKDPKKTLRGFFEREGLDLEYETDEKGSGNNRAYIARVRLPIENASGEEIVAEGSASKKKEAVAACAYEACRIIDAHGMLRNAMHESERSKRAKLLAENDFYESDEDSFLDRTGSVENKRQKRLKRAGKGEDEKIETYESLTKLLTDAVKEITALHDTLENDEQVGKEEAQEEIDELDQYMSNVTSRLDKKTRVAIKIRLTVLYKEKKRLEKLIKIVKPTSLPTLKSSSEKKIDSKVYSREVKQDNENKRLDSGLERDQGLSLENKPKLKVETKQMKETENIGEQNETGNVELKPKKSKNLTSVASYIDRIELEEGHRDDNELPVEEKTRNKKGKKKKIYGARMTPASSDTKFADWVPPEGQMGDGKTHLNEKFGY